MSESSDIPPSPSPSSGRKASSEPFESVRAAVERVPGVGLVQESLNGALDVVGSVSPRTRRIAVYAGVGVLGTAGLVQWPVAAAGAAVVWLTQQRPSTAADADSEPARGTQKAASSPARGRRNDARSARCGPPRGRAGS